MFWCLCGVILFFICDHQKLGNGWRAKHSTFQMDLWRLSLSQFHLCLCFCFYFVYAFVSSLFTLLFHICLCFCFIFVYVFILKVFRDLTRPTIDLILSTSGFRRKSGENWQTSFHLIKQISSSILFSFKCKMSKMNLIECNCSLMHSIEIFVLSRYVVNLFFERNPLKYFLNGIYRLTYFFVLVIRLS